MKMAILPLMYSIIEPSSIIAILWTKGQNRASMVFLLIAILALPPSVVTIGWKKKKKIQINV